MYAFPSKFERLTIRDDGPAVDGDCFEAVLPIFGNAKTLRIKRDSTLTRFEFHLNEHFPVLDLTVLRYRMRNCPLWLLATRTALF